MAQNYINKASIKKDGSTYTYIVEPTLYAAASTSNSGATYTASLDNFGLVTGATVQIKFSVTNAVNATLNVNSTGAKNIHYNGAAIAASVLKANHTYTLTYDGTQWQLVGDIDTNTWRGIVDNLTSSTATTTSLSGKQGYLLANGDARDNTKLALTGGILTGGLEIKGHIAGDSSTTSGHGLYSGGMYHNAYNNIILHGDASTGSSGIAFISDKVAADGTITNRNAPSDRAFIQYHACGVTTATAEGTAPTLASGSEEAGRLVIGIGNDSGDKIILQAPGTTDIVHQMGATGYPIPHTTNTNGSVGGTTTPVYVDAGVIKALSYTIAKSVPSDAVFTDHYAWSDITNKPISFTQAAYGTTGWNQLGGRASQSIIKIWKPTDTVDWGTAAHSAVLSYGVADTKGMIDIAYGAPLVSIAGGNVGGSTDATPTWYFKLSATSGATYTFPSSSKTLAAADGSNATGNWSISTSGKADTAGTADKATAANLTTTTNAIAYYSNTTGTFANGQYVTYLNHTAANAGTNNAGYLDGLLISGMAYGEAENLISGTAGQLSYGDAGPQIRFDSSGQTGAMIFDHYDSTSGMGVSFNFVTNQGSAAVKAAGLIARERAMIGGNSINSSYVLYSNGATYINGVLTMNGIINAQGASYEDSRSGAINMNNSDIYGLNSIYTQDSADTAAEGIHFYRSATTVDSLWVNGGNIYFAPNRTIKTDTTESSATTAANSQKVLRLPATITGSRVVYTNGSNGMLAESSVTSTELGYLSGVTSAIQTQLNGKSGTGHNHDTVYLKLDGSNTMTGALKLANNTWNLIGDDAYLGDINKAGHIGIQGKNGNTGLFFTTYNQDTKTTGGAITWDGTKFNITSTTPIVADISGNAATATTAINANYQKYFYHDLLGFCYIATPTYETTTDGSTWTTGTLDKKIFDQKNTTGQTLFENSIIKHRWTWHHNNFSYSGGAYVIMSWRYTSPNAAKTLLVESSSDGTSWTELATASGTWGSNTYAIPINGYAGHTWIRITITKTSETGTSVLANLRLISARPGDQGQGIENEYPYLWDEEKNITLRGNQYLNADNTYYSGASNVKWKGIYATDFFGNASTATEFSSNATVTLTGDVTGTSAGSKKSWSIATTIGTGKVTNAMLAGSIANDKLTNSSLTVGNKSISLGASGTLDDIILSSTSISTTTSWNITTTGAYYVASQTAFTGDGNPGINQNAPYTYGGLYVLRAGNGGAAQIYISHTASNADNTATNRGIRYRSGWNVVQSTSENRWASWATILDDKNYTKYAVAKTDGVTNVAWDSTNNKITKTINGTTTDVVTAATLKAAINVTAADLGLSKAMRFIGVATAAITDGGTEDPVISGYSTKTAGDVVIDSSSSREYVWSTTNKWELLGGDSSYWVSSTGTTAQFWRGDNDWSDTIDGGTLKITNQGNTITIGSQNTSYAHIYNSANIPFIFNKSVLTTSGNLGSSTWPFGNLYLGSSDGTLDNAGIYYKGKQATYRMIRFLNNTSDAYGNGISIGGGGQTIIGAGESADVLVTNIGNGGQEEMYMSSDNNVTIYTNIQNGWDNKKTFTFKTNGTLQLSDGQVQDKNGLVSFVQNTTNVDGTTDWDTLLTPGCYKVQMASWGAATTYHGPNETQSDLYSYGLLLVFRGSNNDGENRVEQIYFPHRDNSSNPIYCRMRNGADTTDHTKWQTWHKLTKGVTWSEVSNKPATSVSWTAGTTAGPTVNVTAAGSSASAAIPAASTSASGIVTTGAQSFLGRKTFGYMTLKAYSDNGTAVQWVGDTYLLNNAGTQVGEYWYNCGDATNITTGQYSWRQYSPNSTPNTTTTGKYETYALPSVDRGLTDNKSYNILTDKGGITLPRGNISIGTDTDTTERQIGVQTAAGQLYMFAQNSSAGSRGLYAPAHGTGSAAAVLVVDTNNNVTLNGKATNVTGVVAVANGGTGSSTKLEAGLIYDWAAVVQGQKWSRLCFVPSSTNVTGSSIILNIRGTRNAVVYNFTLLINTVHAHDQCHINVLQGSDYSAVKFRGTSDNSGNVYLELNDSANSIASGTTQNVSCHMLILTKGTTQPTLYTAFTDGTTLPSGCTAHELELKAYGGIQTNGRIYADKVYGAVWNDYAEYRETDLLPPGTCVQETDHGRLITADQRLIPGASIISDTYGYVQGETANARTPIAVSGRVLAYPYLPREYYHAGMAVCSAPGGTIDIMTREEIREYPDAIIGIVSEIPEYEYWGSGNVEVNGRIWIKVR